MATAERHFALTQITVGPLPRSGRIGGIGSGTGMSGGGTGLMSGGGESMGSIGRGKSGVGGCSMLILDAMCNNPALVGPAARRLFGGASPAADQRIHPRLTCFPFS